MQIDSAVIVEPRVHIYMEQVLLNVLKNLSNETKFYIFHGKLNKDLLEKKYNVEIQNGKIILINMNISNMTRVEYSNMLTTVKFWEQISGENILIFQTDSCLCRHIDTFDFELYKDYGFVGAPSRKTYPVPWQNGGLSLRKKSLMIQAIESKTSNESSWPEDKFFSVIKKHITNPATYELANKFSVEQFYFDKPFGIHSPWKYLRNDEWNKLKNNNMEISLVFNL
jgi:hypothetical protein